MYTSPVGLGRKKGSGWDTPQSWGTPTSLSPQNPEKPRHLALAQAPALICFPSHGLGQL